MNNTSHRLGAGKITHSCVTDFIQQKKEKGFCQGFVISPDTRARLLNVPLASWQHDTNTGDHHHLMGELLRDCNIPGLNPSGLACRSQPSTPGSTVSETPISRYVRCRPASPRGGRRSGRRGGWRTSFRREYHAEAAEGRRCPPPRQWRWLPGHLPRCDTAATGHWHVAVTTTPRIPSAQSATAPRHGGGGAY